MLNLEEIAQRISHPEYSTVADLSDLKLFSDKYPYCQLFPILYLKALSQHNDVRFEEELTNYAYCISDRSQLYSLIHSDTPQAADPLSITELAAEKIIPTIEIIKQVEEIPVAVLEEFIKDISENDEIEIRTEIETPIEVESEIQIDSQQIEPNLSPISLDVEEDEDDFDAEFISLNIRGNDEPTIVAYSEEVVTTLPENTEEIKNDESLSEIKESDSKEESEIEIVLDPINVKFEKELLSEAITANYNLDHLIPIVEAEQKAINEEEIFVPIVETTGNKKSFSSWLRSNENEEQPKFDAEKERINAILDQFIKEEPKISRPLKETIIEEKPKKEFFSPTKKAKESLDVNSMPVSETLAKIFALQGNYPKAIFAYEQLILINPEKKIFFASRIEELKKKLNT